MSLAITKAIEVAPKGIYKTEHLTGVIEQYHVSLVKGQNPNHIQSSVSMAINFDPVERCISTHTRFSVSDDPNRLTVHLRAYNGRPGFWASAFKNDGVA